MSIDATTQPGYSGSPLIELNGSSIFYPPTVPPAAGPVPIPGVHGLVIGAGGSVIRGLAINRFTGHGVVLIGSGQSQVAGNYIGTDASGTLPLGNGLDGVLVLGSRNNVIGGTAVADGNLISGNSGSGVELTSSSSRGLSGNNRVLGNRIGTDVTGTFDLGNGGYGVIASTGGNAIGAITPAGAGSVIAYNGRSVVLLGAVFLPRRQQVRNSVLSNSTGANAGSGIILGSGAEVSVSRAFLTSAFPTQGGGTTVQGQFFGTPQTIYQLQIFANAFSDPPGAGEGQTLVGTATVTTDSDGRAQFETRLPITIAQNQFLSATATDPSNNTSSFFGNARVAAAADLVLVQRASPAPVLSGDKLTYLVTVMNSGPSTATGVTIQGVLPANIVFVSAKSDQGTVSRDQRALSVAVGMLYSGESVTLTVVGGSYVIDVSRGAATPHPTHVVKTPPRKAAAPANVRLVESVVGRRVPSGPASSISPSSSTNFSNSFSS